MSIKSALWDKINKKAQRKEDLSKEIAERKNNVEKFIVQMIEEIDEAMTSTVNTSLLDTPGFREYYVGSVEGRIKTLDSGSKIEVSWHSDSQPGEMPRLNGILIKWSQEYQKQNNCEPELFVDVFSLLFR